MKTINHRGASRLITKIFFNVGIIFFFNACSNNNTTSEIAVPLKAEVLIADISSDQCLNLEKLNAQMQNPQFNVPAAIMTTNFVPLNEISKSKAEYFSYASFYYQLTKANDLNLFTTAHQRDCSSLQLLTASNEVLTYNITKHSDKVITFILSDLYQENIPEYQQKAMANRPEPYEYTVEYISAYELQVTEKFRSIDPLCEEKKSLQFEVTKNITWSESESGLPKQYQLNSAYFNSVQQSLPVILAPPADPIVVEPPVVSEFIAWTTESTLPTDPQTIPINIITVDEILKIMMTPIREELKLCSY